MGPAPSDDRECELPHFGPAVVDVLLRERGRFLRRAAVSADPVAVCRVLIVTTLLAAGVFGVSVGLFRPGWQALSSAIKLPLLLLVTAAVATPAITGVRRALGQSGCFRHDVELVLTTVALVSLALSAFAPIVLLAVQWNASYHQVVVLTVALCGFTGAAGLVFFLNHLSDAVGPETPARQARFSPTLALVSLTVFTLVGTQLAWTMRPFIARPRAEFQWVRPLEGSFLDAVIVSLDSAKGVYHRASAPLPEGRRAYD